MHQPPHAREGFRYTSTSRDLLLVGHSVVAFLDGRHIAGPRLLSSDGFLIDDLKGGRRITASVLGAARSFGFGDRNLVIELS